MRERGGIAFARERVVEVYARLGHPGEVSGFGHSGRRLPIARPAEIQSLTSLLCSLSTVADEERHSREGPVSDLDGSAAHGGPKGEENPVVESRPDESVAEESVAEESVAEESVAEESPEEERTAAAGFDVRQLYHPQVKRSLRANGPA